MTARTLLALSLAAAACGARETPPAAPHPAEAPPAIADSLRLDSLLAETRTRWSVRPLPFTNAFRAGLDQGTRTTSGQPGPRYWQQRVHYRIDAEIDPASGRVTGAETLRYLNQSPDTLRQLVFLLYQNVFSEGVQRVRRVPVTGGVSLERVAVDGRAASAEAQQANGPRYRVDGTIMTLDLPVPLAPGGETSVDIAWSFTVPPRGAPRTGHDDHEAYVVAQWYPQVAVYDDLQGWHARPYWSNGEFYLEYGDFDVTITAPEGWIVAASGTLQNPEEVLSEEVQMRLRRAIEADRAVGIVTADELEAQAATVRDPGGTLTWSFAARDVRDFAFATSNRYVWDAAGVNLPDANGDGVPERVLVNALYRPEAPTWAGRAVDMMRHSVRFHAERWHPYIYPHITAAEGPIGGMEYPMLVFIGNPRDEVGLYSVLSHEIAHQWWAMMVGSNESEFGWMDEGLASYTEDLSVTDRYPRVDAPALTMMSYLSIAGSDQERPIMREGDLYGIGPQYGVATYSKPATLFRALEYVIGQQPMRNALRVYARRWLLKHPTPYDLFHTMEDVAGRDLDWFWWPWFYETATLDHAVARVTADSAETLILIEDLGDAPMPVPVRITFADGTTRDERLPVEPWLDGRVRQLLRIESTARVTQVEIDPDGLLPDVDRSNNVWSG